MNTIVFWPIHSGATDDELLEELRYILLHEYAARPILVKATAEEVETLKMEFLKDVRCTVCFVPLRRSVCNGQVILRTDSMQESVPSSTVQHSVCVPCQCHWREVRVCCSR